MNEILNKRMADMTLREVMEATNLVEISKNPTLANIVIVVLPILVSAFSSL